MTKQEVVELVKSFDNEDDFVVRSYSGRSMYGRKCLGIDCRDPLECMGQLVCLLCDQFEETSEVREVLEWLGAASFDSMGLDYILYFPGLTWSKDSEEENEYEK